MQFSHPEPSSFTGAISSPHVLATEAGCAVYRDGGNAIDAAIAAASVLTVVYPHNVTLGGDLVALIRDPDGNVTCVNASGWSAESATLQNMREHYGDSLPIRGVGAITVPGGVRGWQAMLQLGGRLPLARLLEPATAAASDGVPVAKSLASSLCDPENADLQGDLGFDQLFRPLGVALQEGDILRQPALAATLATIQAEGADAFYTGRLAQTMVQALRSRGSQLSERDFEEYAPQIVDPLRTDFGDLTVLTSPPNTHGFILLRVLRALEARGIRDPLGKNLDVLMRLFHHANTLRSEQLADPTFANIDLDELINGDLDRTTPTAEEGATHRVAHGDTVGIATADSDGWAVSLIQSVYFAFGSGVLDPATGVLFQNRGTSFSLQAGTPNEFAPRKRPAHTLMPTLTIRGNRLRHVLSTMGGQGQPQILAQVLLHALSGESLAAAVAAPRAIVGVQCDGDTEDTVVAEADVSVVAQDALGRSGLTVREVPSGTESLGQTNVILLRRSGSFEAACDPRADGSAAVIQFARHQRAGQPA